MRASKGLLKGLNPTMAMTALTVITLFLLFGVFVPDTAAAWFVGAKDQIIAGFKCGLRFALLSLRLRLPMLVNPLARAFAAQMINRNVAGATQ